MSGRGKGGKGLGKGGAKRHKKVLRDNIQGITKPAIRRLVRRGGVKRVSGLIYEETRGVLKVFLENVIRDTVTYTEHSRRKTVTAQDVVFALKLQGRTLYGFGSDFLSFAKTKFKPKVPTQSALVPQASGHATTAPAPTVYILPAIIERDCDELHVCCNVGLHLHDIIQYFDEFINFIHCTTIDEIKNNDTVQVFMENEKSSQKVDSVLTINKKNNNTSLYYDYILHTQLYNDFSSPFPNTLIPLNLYTFNSPGDYDHCASDFDNITVRDLQQKLTCITDTPAEETPDVIKISVKANFMLCFDYVLTPDHVPFDYMFQAHEARDDFWLNDAATTFFQMYSFLRSYRKLFTHYNLNRDNVVLTFIPSKHFKFIYKENGKTVVEFVSPFLVKIRDFSKSVMLDITDKFYENIKRYEKSARENGYNDVLDNFNRGINMSEDLSLLHTMRGELTTLPLPRELKELLNKISYRPFVEQKSTRNGINNVEDLYTHLLHYLSNKNPHRQLQTTDVLYGTFTIHTDVLETLDDISKNSFDFRIHRTRR